MEAVDEPKDLNREAYKICFKSIAKYPQSSFGSYLVADGVLNSDVTLFHMANIELDSQECVDKVNEIHGLFKIPVVVTPKGAEAFVRSFAFESLIRIQEEMLHIARERNMDVPKELSNEIVNYPDNEREHKRINVTADMINFEGVEAMQEFLESNSNILNEVKKRIKAKADYYRSKSQNHITENSNLR